MSEPTLFNAAPQSPAGLMAELTRLAQTELGIRFAGVESLLLEGAELVTAFFPVAGACLLSGKEHQAGAARLGALLEEVAELIDALTLDLAVATSKEEGR